MPALAYVAAVTRDLAAATDLLERGLGLCARALEPPGGAAASFGVGATALILVEPGHPLVGEASPGVHHLVLEADDPQAAAQASDLPVAADPAVTLGARSQVRLDPAATAGVEVRFGASPESAPPAEPVIQRIDHIGIASASNVEGEAVFVDRLGCPVESRQTDIEVAMAVESFTSDRYGVVYHNRPPEPVGGLRVSFLTVGDCELELLEPFDPGSRYADEVGPARDRPGNTRGDRGAIGRYIARRGPGLHHLALRTADIDAALAQLHANGFPIIDRVGRPGSRRARIGFIQPGALGGVLVHLVEREEL